MQHDDDGSNSWEEDDIDASMIEEFCRAAGVPYKKQKMRNWLDHDDPKKAAIEELTPEGLNDEEMAFFQKWAKKFDLSRISNATLFLLYREGNGSRLGFRDLLWQFQNVKAVADRAYRGRPEVVERDKSSREWSLSNGYQVEDKSETIRRTNEQQLTLSADYLIDEAKFLGGDYTKKGDLRRQLSQAHNLAKTAITDFGARKIKPYKLYERLSAKYELDPPDEIVRVLTLGFGQIDPMKDSEREWLQKKTGTSAS